MSTTDLNTDLPTISGLCCFLYSVTKSYHSIYTRMQSVQDRWCTKDVEVKKGVLIVH